MPLTIFSVLKTPCEDAKVGALLKHLRQTPEWINFEPIILSGMKTSEQIDYHRKETKLYYAT